MKSQPRRYSSEQRASIVRGFRSWSGSREAYAAAVGIPKTTLHRMLASAGVPAGGGGGAPAMLEVVAVPSPAPAGPVAAVRVRVSLPGGAELDLDGLPPARWVAELAAELGRC